MSKWTALCSEAIRALRSRIPPPAPQQPRAFWSNGNLEMRSPAAAPQQTIAVCGGCECGIAYIEVPDSIDSGATFCCENGHPIVFDVASPEARAEFYRRAAPQPTADDKDAEK